MRAERARAAVLEANVETPRQAPRRHSLARRSAVRTVEALSALCGGRAFYRRRHLTRPGLRVRRETLAIEAWPREFEGFRVAQLSDLHAGAFLGSGDLADVVAATNELAPDVIALTGDFITHRIEEAWPIVDDLAGLRARDGVFAVFGNHDYKARREAELVQALAARGIRVLRNAGARIVRGEHALAVIGVEDLEEAREIDVAAARADVQTEDFELALCHHPLGAPSFARPRCVAVLSGHTHGTQLDLPWVRSAGPAHPGVRVELGSTRLIVSRGLGVIGLPLRIGAPTEIVLLELRGRSA